MTVHVTDWHCVCCAQAFPDCEACFGSSGSFFAGFDPREGSFEANPPFCEAPMAAMAERFEALLADPERGPLSFVVVVPACAFPLPTQPRPC